MIISLLMALVTSSVLWQYLLLFTFLTWMISVFAVIYVQRCFHIGKARYAPLTLFLGGIIMMGIFLNSASKTLSGKGVTWKGRTYSSDK